MKSHIDVDHVADRMELARAVVGDGPVLMLNLLRFRAVADYSRHPELAPPSPISGAEAYRKYLALLRPRMQARGSEISFMGRGGPFLIGPEAERWDLVFFARWPSMDALAASPGDPDYQAVVGHRTAALEDSRLLPVAEDPDWPVEQAP